MPATKQLTSVALRRFDGYVLTCPDPGEDYTRLIFTLHNDVDSCVLKAVPIEKLIVSDQRRVGACLPTMYSHQPIFDHWVEHMLKVGVSHIDVYYTSVHDLQATSLLYGVYQRSDQLIPFQPVANPAVTYRYFRAPTHRFYFGQTTLVNECVYRNRWVHKYILVVDSDEFLHDRHAGLDLVSRLDTLMPENVASISLGLALVYADCPQNNASLTASPNCSSLFAEKITHLPPSGFEHQPPKTIIAPNRVRLHANHRVREAAEGYELEAHVTMRDMYLKHVKFNPGSCDGLVDEQDAAEFNAALDKHYA